MAICKNTFKAAYRYGVPARPAGDVAEAGRLPMLPRRCRRTRFFTVTFRREKRSRADERCFGGRSAHNEIEKVVEKGRFPRHLPVNENQEYPQKGTGRGLIQKTGLEGDGKMPLLSAPSGGENEAGPARDVSEAGRLITKSRRWWKKAAFPGTCQSTKGQVCG